MQLEYVYGELGAPALFYLGLMANPDTVDPKYFSLLPKTTAPPIMQLALIYSSRPFMNCYEVSNHISLLGSISEIRESDFLNYVLSNTGTVLL